MKHLVLLTGTVALCFNSLFSQCSFTATISPNNPILCPYDTVQLSTQVYDSYQWYKDGNLLSGETNQTLMVTSNDAGSEFYVACTLASCTENSDTVLVDGWVFLLPYVITHTTPVLTGGNGEAYYCAGTTVELELGLPYTENITWYENGNPIPGADSNFLYVTQTGNYTASGAPGICPDFILNLGVDIPITIMAPFEPDWYDYYSQDVMWWQHECQNCNDCIFYDMITSNPVDSGTNFDGNWAGDLMNLYYGVMYRVECHDSLGCVGIDTVMFQQESIEEHPFLQLNIYPNPAQDLIQLYLQDDLENYRVRIIDVHGKIVSQQKMNGTLDVSFLSSGIYTLEVFSEKYYLRKRMLKL